MVRFRCSFWWVMVVAILVGAVGTSTASATIPGRNGRIVFERTDRGLGFVNSELYGINDDGSDLRQLTNTPGRAERYPSWSYSGSKIFFGVSNAATFTGDGVSGFKSFGLYQINADGGGEEQVLADKFIIGAKVSPDGLRFIVESWACPTCRNTKYEVMDRDGSNPRYLPCDAADWSPDSKKIVCSRFEVGISFLNRNGGEEKQIFAKPSTLRNVLAPSWSPDGSKILFGGIPFRDNPNCCSREDLASEIYVMNTDGSGFQQLTTDQGDGESRFPSWSPDGRKIVFIKYNVKSDRSVPYELWVMNADGSEQRKLLNNSNPDDWFVGPVWQPLVSPDLHNGCNGVGCSERPRLIINDKKKLLGRLKKTVGFSKSKFVVSGKLLNQSGAPISGALISVLQRASAVGSTQVNVGEVKTNGSGVWRAVVGRGPSRSVRFGYRVFQKDVKYAVVSTVFAQRVRGVVSFKLPKRAKRGKKIVLEGSLAGGFVPRHGKIVELQVFFKGKYRVFKTLRTDAKGVFKFRFAFGRSYRPGVYRLRVNVRSEPAWPFLATVSKPRKIIVR